MLLNCKLLDKTRTALQLLHHPTLNMFVSACITNIQDRAWHVPSEPVTKICKNPTNAAQTRQANPSCKPGAAPPASTPLTVALTTLLHRQGQPAGQLAFASESPTEFKFRWQVQPNLLRPCLTAQIWRSTLAGHKSNCAWVAVDCSGAVNLTCLHPLCQERGRSNRRHLGFIPLSVLHPNVTTGADDTDSTVPSPTRSQDTPDGSVTRKFTSLYPNSSLYDPRPAKVPNLGQELFALPEVRLIATATLGGTRPGQQRGNTAAASCDRTLVQQQKRETNKLRSCGMVQPRSCTPAESGSITAQPGNFAAGEPSNSRAAQRKKRAADDVSVCDIAQQQSHAAATLCSSELCSTGIVQQQSSAADELISGDIGPQPTSIVQSIAQISRDKHLEKTPHSKPGRKKSTCEVANWRAHQYHLWTLNTTL